MFRRRITVIYLLILFLFSALFYRLFSMQIVNRSKYRYLSQNNCVWVEKMYSLRGRILDRNGEVLAKQRRAFHLLINPRKLVFEHATIDQRLREYYKLIRDARVRKEKERMLDLIKEEKDLFYQETVVRRLTMMLALSPDYVVERLVKTFRYAILKWAPEPAFYDIGYENIVKVKMAPERYPGCSIDEAALRYYPNGNIISHVLGYMGTINEKEIKSLKGSGRIGSRLLLSKEEMRRFSKTADLGSNLIGRSGVERICNNRMRAKIGERVLERQVNGEVSIYCEEMPEAGKDVQITIDLKLQKVVRDALKEYVGAAVVMDPYNGDILAMVSMPDYDPNQLIPPIDHLETRKLLDDKRFPLLNRCVQNMYPPGSLFKIVTACAALEEKVIYPGTVYECTGALQVGRFSFGCWREWGHGRVNVEEAIKGSCNVFFMKAGRKLGIEKLSDYAHRFSIGRKTGIELPYERAGVMPSPRWKKEKLNQSWYPGDTYQVSFGQGQMLCTPLQMVCVCAAIANDGWLVRPRLLPHQTSIRKEKIALSRSTLQVVQRGMWRVVNEQGGTAYSRIRFDHLETAGKTGSAETGMSRRRASGKWFYKNWRKTHSWYMGYAPADQPQIAFCVLAEYAGHGSHAAAPVGKKILEGWAAMNGIDLTGGKTDNE